ncbi:Tic20 family protein [Leptolyngbya sp. PCC 6406]|uniref:Tic20 family protein n=1 Tax=Leptolyngbya sp. PCC 6406 TaxID=1173264 RepID=UPI0002ACC286|nr:Tic20 family protein [Leptolyngbya sp. PCC 6406]
MTWRGNVTAQDRLFGSLPYLLPLVEVCLLALFYAVRYDIGLFAQFPIFTLILVPLSPLIRLYTGFPFAGLIVFILLLSLVVRNTNISRFIRFNTMQAILLDILLILGRLILNMVLEPILRGGLILDTLVNVVVLGILAAVVYCVSQTVLGREAQIPTLSDAVNMQVP